MPPIRARSVGSSSDPATTPHSATAAASAGRADQLSARLHTHATRLALPRPTLRCFAADRMDRSAALTESESGNASTKSSLRTRTETGARAGVRKKRDANPTPPHSPFVVVPRRQRCGIRLAGECRDRLGGSARWMPGSAPRRAHRGRVSTHPHSSPPRGA